MTFLLAAYLDRRRRICHLALMNGCARVLLCYEYRMPSYMSYIALFLTECNTFLLMGDDNCNITMLQLFAALSYALLSTSHLFTSQKIMFSQATFPVTDYPFCPLM